MTTQGGVAKVPQQRWVHDHPNIHPNRTTFRAYRRVSFCVMFVCGNVLARHMANWEGLKNSWYTRPDFKPKAAMVSETTDYDSVALKQVLEQNYQ